MVAARYGPLSDCAAGIPALPLITGNFSPCHVIKIMIRTLNSGRFRPCWPLTPS